MHIPCILKVFFSEAAIWKCVPHSTVNVWESHVFMEWVTSTSSFDNSSQLIPAQVSERAKKQKSRSSEPVSQSAPVITGSLIDRLRARGVFGGMGTTDTQSTVQVPLASNASSSDAEHRTLQEYCCALLNRSPQHQEW